jgi:cob(I)alamin adenosyltransferase
MKIYTRSGDNGLSCLYNGDRLKKSDVVFDVLGNIDELSAQIGVVYALACEDGGKHIDIKKDLEQLMSRLLDIGSVVATPVNSAKTTKTKLKRVEINFDELIMNLEIKIDQMMSSLPPLKNFILPTGNLISAQTHVARAVCRRVERSLVCLKEMNNDVNDGVLKLFNRLSDYLFVLARYLNDAEYEIIYKKQ